MSGQMEWEIYGEVVAALKTGDVDGALRQIDETRSETRGIAAIMGGLEAECHRRRGDRAAALAILEDILTSRSENFWTCYDIASLYREDGRKAECAAAYRKAHLRAGWEESERNGYTFLHDYFSPSIPAWSKWFAERIVAEPIEVLEIGSWQGGSAAWMLDKIVSRRGGRLTCVDTFEGSSEHAGWIGGIGDRIGDLFDANIAATGHAAQCRKLVGRSQDVLRGLSQERFDFIYIDGAHEARYVIEDAVLAFGLLNDGGFICFDDYDFKFATRPRQDTSRAIDCFLDLYEDEISFVEKGRQVLLRKGQPPGNAEPRDAIAASGPSPVPPPERPVSEPAADDPLRAAILTAAAVFIAGRDAGAALRAIYNDGGPASEQRLSALADLLPADQVALTGLVDSLAAPDLTAAVILLAALRKARTRDGWIHYNVCKYLGTMAAAGVAAAKLPAIVHSLLALEELTGGQAVMQALPRQILARELATFAPPLEPV